MSDPFEVLGQINHVDPDTVPTTPRTNHQRCECHADPCFRCGRVLVRARLTPASRAIPGRKRGWICGECIRALTGLRSPS